MTKKASVEKGIIDLCKSLVDSLGTFNEWINLQIFLKTLNGSNIHWEERYSDYIKENWVEEGFPNQHRMYIRDAIYKPYREITIEYIEKEEEYKEGNSSL